MENNTPGWTSDSPEDQEINAAADAIDRKAGIAQPRERNTSFMRGVALPILAAGIVLIIMFWLVSAWLGMV
ncbi:hypothetical protein [Acetobacter sp.]|uniref:hypothetical protein n=1 Tax=Acetobacter sp. TaxID=440 RepID=UPI0039E8E32A